MSIFDSFPLMNAYSVNLDWILKKIKELKSDNTLNENKITAIEKKNVEQDKKIDKVESTMPTEIRKIITDMVSSGEIDTVLESGITGFVNVLDFGAKGDGVTDDTKAFTDAINHCITNNVGLYVPAVGAWNQEGGYILSKTLNITHPMVFICQPNSLLNWKNVGDVAASEPKIDENGICTFDSGYGINIDYGMYRGHKGFYRFGVVQGPKTYFEPGAASPSGRYWTGIRIGNGDLADVSAVYISYWNVGIMLTSNTDFTGNNMVHFGVADDCATGILFKPQNNKTVSVTDVTFNTIGICREGLVFEGEGIVDFLRLSGNQIWTEYPGYTTICNKGATLNNCEIRINNVNNRNTGETYNKTGNSLEWYGPIIGDGNGGEFNVNHCTVELGVWNGEMGGGSPIAFNFSGWDLHFRNTWRRVQATFDQPLEMITTESEENFNGGIGGAIWGNIAYLKWKTDRNYSPGETVTLYFFAQNITNDSAFTITPVIPPRFKIGYENRNWMTKRCISVTLEFTEQTVEGWVFKFLYQIL